MNAIKNMKLTAKLIAGLLCIALIAMATGVVGIAGMKKLSNEDEAMYLYNTKPMGLIAVMYDTLASQRICANNMVIFLTADPEFSKAETESLAEKEALFDSAFQDYKNYLSNEEEEALYDSIDTYYYNDFAAAKQKVKNAIASGNPAAMALAIKGMDDKGAQVSGFMDEAFALNDDLAVKQVEGNKDLSGLLTKIMVGVVILGAALSVVLALFLSSLIARPLKRMLAATKQVGEFGDLTFPEEMVASVKKDASYHDEVGQLALSFSVMMDALIEKTKILETVATGDLTPEVKLVSGRDTIGKALAAMLQNLNEMFHEIEKSASQVSMASRQISDGAQNLAQGATEQAATVEELSRSIAQVAEKTQNSADMAGRAAQLADTIKGNAEKGSQQMEMMRTAVGEISEASQAINKVIKAIDDIAFQTNILALNAAVEAARAGQHGKGFAVVADEVRNLAQKSADSAQESGVLIANSMEKTTLGVRIADETYASLAEIVQGINESNRIINDIAHSSEEQRGAVTQIDQGINQVSQVVHQNSATAEESAAASEEMSGQAHAMERLVSQFKLR